EDGEISLIGQPDFHEEVGAVGIVRAVVIGQYDQRADGDRSPEGVFGELELPAAVAAHVAGEILHDHSPQVHGGRWSFIADDEQFDDVARGGSGVEIFVDDH